MARGFDRTTRRRRGLWRDAAGATAVIFVLSAVPLLGFFAFTIDYGMQARTAAVVREAADGAAMAGTQAAANAYQTNGYDFAAARRTGIEAANNWFTAQLAMSGFHPKPPPTLGDVDVALSADRKRITTSLACSATVPSFFTPLIGISHYRPHGSSSAVYTMPNHLDIHVMVDSSPSMALIADPANWKPYADHMRTDYPTIYRSGSFMQGYDCMFACHYPNADPNVANVAGTDTCYLAEDYAQRNAINDMPRIDVVRSAVGQMFDDIAPSTQRDHYRVALYQFNDDASSLFPLGHDVEAARASARALIPLPSQMGSAHTAFSTAMTSMLRWVTASGDGLSAATPKQALFIVTDGMDNNSLGGTERSGPFDYAKCDAIKNLGADIYVLYTKYYEIDNPIGQAGSYHAAYASWVLPHAKPVDRISDNLRRCASSDANFFVATDAVSIQLALRKMLKAALATPTRFSN